MSGSSRPNDQMHLPGLGVPVDPLTGHLLKPVALARVMRLKESVQALRAVLHELDGTTEGSRPGDRRMSLAFTKLDEAMLWAVSAILEHGDG